MKKLISLFLCYLFILQLTGFANVIEKTDLSFNIEIKPKDISSYNDFIKKNKQYRKPISKAEFLKQVQDAKHYLEAYPSGKTTKDLRKKIISELNIGFLLHKLNKRELVVKVIATHQYEGFTEKELLFEDPQVGVFSVLCLVPDKMIDLHSAIICLHGHGDNGHLFRDGYFGKALAQEGFTVILPDFVVTDDLKIDSVVSEKLYLNGFSLMGLRVYETLLVIEYLKYKNLIGRIGIIGHSGGSDAAYLVSIISPDLQALVYDMYPRQLDLLEGKMFHCETIPSLAYYSPQINNVATLKIPSLKFLYGYTGPEDRSKVVNFFKNRLGKSGMLKNVNRSFFIR
jgi:dienelactone hydrolase